LLAAAIVQAMMIGPLAAETLIVTSSAEDGPGSLWQAIGQAQPGDTITFAPELGGQILTFPGERLDLSDGLAIDGDLDDDGNPDITLDCEGRPEVIGIYNMQGTAAVDGLVVTGCAEGIRNIGGDMTLRNSWITANLLGIKTRGSNYWDPQPPTPATMEITGSAVTDNASTGIRSPLESGLQYRNTLTLRTSEVARNGDGGILNHYGHHHILDSSIEDNLGSGIAADYDATIEIVRSRISGNVAEEGGGLRCNDSDIRILDSTIHGNSADVGGGLLLEADCGYSLFCSSGSGLIERSTVSGNTARIGAGILNRGDYVPPADEWQPGRAGTSPLKLRNSTLSGNKATEDAAAIAHVPYAGDLELVNVTIMDHSLEGQGSAVQVANVPASISNTVVAGTQGGTDCAADQLTLQSSWIGDGSCAAGLSGDPLLGSLQDNGGRTPTHAPLPGSALIDAGDTNAAELAGETDQRGWGYPRIINAAVDIGAVEWPIDAPLQIGLYDQATAWFRFAPALQDSPPSLEFIYGAWNKQWQGIAGDWDGDGSAQVGTYAASTGIYYLKSDEAGVPATQFRFGAAGAGWLPLAGDWDGNGTDSIGAYDPVRGLFFLRNHNSQGPADAQFRFGAADLGWQPIAGDWNGDGVDSIGLYDASRGLFFLRNSNSVGPAHAQFRFGPVARAWNPVAGDWNGNGQDTVGLHQPTDNIFHLTNENGLGPADIIFQLQEAPSNLKPLVLAPYRGDVGP
jgi:hypothetical protein